MKRQRKYDDNVTADKFVACFYFLNNLLFICLLPSPKERVGVASGSVCLLLAKSKIFQVYWSVDCVIVCLPVC